MKKVILPNETPYNRPSSTAESLTYNVFDRIPFQKRLFGSVVMEEMK